MHIIIHHRATCLSSSKNSASVRIQDLDMRADPDQISPHVDKMSVLTAEYVSPRCDPSKKHTRSFLSSRPLRWSVAG